MNNVFDKCEYLLYNKKSFHLRKTGMYIAPDFRYNIVVEKTGGYLYE